MFQEIKNKVKKIIIDKNTEEINEETNNQDKGIYMVYIDNFDDDKIIPIYIGQTGAGKSRNFQTRFKEHLQEVMALNRLKHDYYKELLLENFYGGRLKACKIFKYMVDHNCTLRDFHMIVLEKIDTNSEKEYIQSLLDEREQFYFKEYLPAFFGFNQINSLVEANKEFYKAGGSFVALKDFVPSDLLLKYDLEDCENFIKYFGYGYTKFNYYHSFDKEPIIPENDSRLTIEYVKKKKELKEKHFDENRFSAYDKKVPILREKIDEITKRQNDNTIILNEKYKPQIKQYCIDNKISLIHKYDSVLNTIIFQEKSDIEIYEKYLKRKKINTNLLNVFNQDSNFVSWRDDYIYCINEKVKLFKELKECHFIRQIDDLMRLLPKKNYDVLPLHDRYKEFQFGKVNNFEIVINFEFSNSGKITDYWYFAYSIIKMDYIYRINDKIIEKKNIFLNPPYRDDSCKNNYFEKNKLIRTQPKIEPFNVRRDFDYISTTMELKNGINDYTYMHNTKYDLVDILDEIDTFIHPFTNVKVLVRDKMKTKCIEFINDYYKHNNSLKEKILNSLKEK